ncbi:unnamed protein product [Closterium sp. NIES-54]
MSSRPEPLSPQQLCEWFTLRTHLQTGVTGAGDSAAGDTGAGGGRLTAGAGGTEVLHLLVLEVLVPRVLELPGLVVLGALGLETLRSLELLVRRHT